MQEHRRLAGTDQSDNALIASRSTKYGHGKASKEKKRCGYCGYTGHTTDECNQRKAEEEGKEFKGKGNKNKDKGKISTNADDSDGSTDSEHKANYASIFAEFPSQRQFEDDDSIHVFSAYSSTMLPSPMQSQPRLCQPTHRKRNGNPF